MCRSVYRTMSIMSKAVPVYYYDVYITNWYVMIATVHYLYLVSVFIIISM